MMLSDIYGGWKSLIILWGLWLLVAAFWRIIYAMILWEDGSKMEKTLWRSSSTRFHLIGIFFTAMRLTNTTASGMHFHQLKIHGWLIGGSVIYLLSFWPYQRLIHFWFYATFSTMGYVGRELLRCWSFVGSWSGNLLIIYTLIKVRRGLIYCQTPSIGWLLQQGTQ